MVVEVVDVPATEDRCFLLEDLAVLVFRRRFLFTFVVLIFGDSSLLLDSVDIDRVTREY